MRRIAAVILPELACELAQQEQPIDGPFAVIVDHDESTTEEVVEKNAVLHAVDRKAWSFGARPGQTASVAAAYVGKLEVVRIARSRGLDALGAMAELSMAYGVQTALTLRLEKGQLPLRDEAKAATLRYPLGAGAGPLDTVWLDITGCASLVGGEDVLAAELTERAYELGHRARVAIADGPRIAQALGRWADNAHLIAPTGRNGEALRSLPVASLPLQPDLITWLGKLGILRIDDLAKLDRARLAHRLGVASRDLLDIIAGYDSAPLCAHTPPRCIVETITFEHEIASTEPLLFVLRGLANRALARLNARGEACGAASISLGFDRAVVELANRQNRPVERESELSLELPVPLSREGELMRALTARLERTELAAPVVSLSLTLDDLTEQRRHQLQIGGKANTDPSALPTLLAELNAQLGQQRVGVLELVDRHRPEAQSRLVPVSAKSLDTARRKKKPLSSMHLGPPPLVPDEERLPTRILPEPIPIPEPDRGATLIVDDQTFVIDRIRHTGRLERVEWWSSDALSRDYFRAWLHTPSEAGTPRIEPAKVIESATGTRKWHTTLAWLFIDRDSGQAFLHGWFD